MAPTSRRARDIALPENKLVVLRPFPSLVSNAARTRPRVNGGKRESKDMLNDTLQWLNQKDGVHGSQTVPDREEKDQRQSESFSFSNPSQNQGIVSSSNTSSWPAVEEKRPHRRRNSAGSGLHSAPAASGGDDRPAFAPAPIGGSSREKSAADDNVAKEGDDDQEESDAAMHIRSTKRSWRSFFMNRAGRGIAAPYRKDPEHDSAMRSKPSTPIWRSFFLGRSDRGNDNSPKAAAMKQRRRRLLVFRERKKDSAGKWHRTKSDPEESRPIPVAGDSGGRGKVTRGGAGRSGSIPSTPSTTISVSTGSTLSTSKHGTARRKNGANALPEASPKIPQAKPNPISNPNPRPSVLSSAAAARLTKNEDVRDKGVVAPSPAAGGDGSHRRRSSRTGESKVDQRIQEASRSSTDLRGQENHRRDNDNDSASSNGGGRKAAAGTDRLSLKLDGPENRRGRSRDRGGSNINRGNRVASVDAGRLCVKLEGLQNRRGRSTRDLGGSSGVDRVAAAAATTRSRASRSPSLVAAVKPEKRSGNGGPDIAATDAGGGSNNDEVYAAPENRDESPLPSSDGSGWPVDGQRQQRLAPSSSAAAVAAAAARPGPARNPVAARSVFWRQTTGSLERVQDHLFGADLHAYSHAPDGRVLQKWGNRSRTSEEGKTEQEESKATAAARAARKPNGANVATAWRGQKNRAQEEKARRQQHPPAPPTSVWVAQYNDKSDRHGVAFLMSDGSVVMRFRDDTVLVSEPMSGAGDWEERGALECYVEAGEGKASPSSPLRFTPEGGVSEPAETTSNGGGGGGGGDRGAGGVKKKRRQDGQQQQGHIRRTRYTMPNVPPYLEKKAKLLATFRGRLLVLAAEEDALHGGGGNDGGSRDRSRKGEAPAAEGATTPWEPSVLVEAYWLTRHSCLFVLSDSTVQLAFSDRTKILMAGNSDLVTFIHGDGQRELETVSFARALKDNRTDITERVEYSKRLINFLQEEQEHELGGGNAARQTARE